MFEKAPRIRDIAERLIDDHHPHLRDAKELVGYYTRADGGVSWAGKCKKCTSFERFMTGETFHIFIIDLIFEQWPLDKLYALIDHELCHITRKQHPPSIHPITFKQIPGEWMKKSDPDNWGIREHDVEEFSDVIHRHGLWETGIEKFAEAVREVPYQMTLADAAREEEENLRAVQ